MKVGTDGVLLGAWAELEEAASILDIGTGTGLIALMAAQRNAQARIDALEIEPAACREAAYNIRISPWAERIRFCGANIYPMLLNVKDGKSVNLGSPLKLVHKNGSTMADYDAQLKKLYAKYQLAIGKLTELLEVRIANPVNCMSEVMAKLVIPKKYQAEALDLFKAQYDVWSCTAHDIYFAISEILFMLECEGASGSRIAKMEEQIARALSMNWAEYDFPEM